MKRRGSLLFAAVLVLPQATIATSAAGQDRRDIAASPTRQIAQWTNSIGMKFVRMEAGEFMMGTPETEPGRYENETLHPVRITGGYLLGAHEVTRGQFRTFVDATGLPAPVAASARRQAHQPHQMDAFQ